LENTLTQANALKVALEEDYQVMVLPMMRYWHPRACDVVDVLKVFNPERIVLLPLYPQFSTTTTESTIDEWMDVCKDWQTDILNNYYDDPDFIKAHQELIRPILN
jgi:protoporphyrin/coproporphyrin ferrochelatase